VASACAKSPKSRVTPANWIRIVARRYNQHGPEALADQRQHNLGASPLLTEQQQQQHLLAQAPPDGGLWSGRHPLPGGWASSEGGKSIPNEAGKLSSGLVSRFRCLVLVTTRLTLPYKKPVPRELPEQVRQVQHAYPAACEELWAMDENRVGLKPGIRQVWASRGQRPVIRVKPRYEWLYVYGFLHPETGAIKSAPAALRSSA
jgi:hypothetical protein